MPTIGGLRFKKKGGYFQANLGRYNKQKRINTLTKKVSIINNMIEKKHIDTTTASTASNDSACVLLTMNAQNTTSGTRNGLQIYVTNIYFKINIRWAVTAIGIPLPVRIIIFRDKMTSTVNPPLKTELLEAATTNDMYNNVYEGTRFVVMYDKTHVPPNPGIVAGPTIYKQVTLRKKVNKPVYFGGTASAQASVGRGHYYICYITDVTAASGDAPTINAESRAYFKDL